MDEPSGERALAYLKQNLFHPRMIRPVVGGGGLAYLKQKKKELSTKGH